MKILRPNEIAGHRHAESVEAAKNTYQDLQACISMHIKEHWPSGRQYVWLDADNDYTTALMERAKTWARESGWELSYERNTWPGTKIHGQRMQWRCTIAALTGPLAEPSEEALASSLSRGVAEPQPLATIAHPVGVKIEKAI